MDLLIFDSILKDECIQGILEKNDIAVMRNIIRFAEKAIAFRSVSAKALSAIVPICWSTNSCCNELAGTLPVTA